MSRSDPQNSSPYKGLMPYSEADFEFFFGREATRDNIINNLFASRFTLLYGSSGVGKSSILRAGVAPRLEQLSKQNLNHHDVVIVFNSWHHYPQEELMRRIGESVRAILDEQILESLMRCNTFTEQIELLTRKSACELFIILDQFEDYFLYHSNEWKGGSFAFEFARAANRSDLRVSFLVSIREDSLAKIDHFKGHINNLFDNLLRIEHLDREGARAAIMKPIEQFNKVISAENEKISIESELVEAVLDQVATGRVIIGDLGRGVVSAKVNHSRIETPFLQLVMMRLWDEEIRAGSRTLSLKTLNLLGGAEEIVKIHLDNSMSMLLPKEQKLAARIFNYLVTPSGTKIAHSASDLAKYVGINDTDVTSVLHKLSAIEVRILRMVNPPQNRPDELYYEIFHDVLAPAILSWQARYESEQKIRQTTRRLFLSLTATLLMLALMAGLTVFALSQRAEAERQRDRAQQALSIVAEQDRSVRYSKAVLRGHNGPVSHAEFSPDGSRIVTAGQDGTARIWDAKTGDSIAVLSNRRAPLSYATFSPDGSLIFTNSTDGVSQVWDAASYKLLNELQQERQRGPATLSPNGKMIIVKESFTINDQVETIGLWDVITGDLVREFPARKSSDDSFVISPDGSRIVIADDNNTATIWDIATGEAVLKLDNISTIKVMAFSPDGKLIAIAGDDSRVRVRKSSTGKSIALLDTGLVTDFSINKIQFNDTEKSLIVFSSEGGFYQWDTGTWEIIIGLQKRHFITSPLLSPNGRYLAQTSPTGTVSIWVIKLGIQIGLLQGHLGYVRANFSPNGKYLVTASSDGTARIWDLSIFSQSP